MEEPNFSYLNSFTGGDKAFEGKILAIIKTDSLKKEISI
jgi:hypothetical protein